MEKMKKILFTIITTIILFGIAAFGIITCVNEDGSLIEKIFGVAAISVVSCSYDIVINLYLWDLIQ